MQTQMQMQTQMHMQTQKYEGGNRGSYKGVDIGEDKDIDRSENGVRDEGWTYKYKQSGGGCGDGAGGQNHNKLCAHHFTSQHKFNLQCFGH